VGAVSQVSLGCKALALNFGDPPCDHGRVSMKAVKRGAVFREASIAVVELSACRLGSRSKGAV